eukprot:9107642-Pyramimonas_sp.AAC.1
MCRARDLAWVRARPVRCANKLDAHHMTWKRAGGPATCHESERSWGAHRWIQDRVAGPACAR